MSQIESQHLNTEYQPFGKFCNRMAERCDDISAQRVASIVRRLISPEIRTISDLADCIAELTRHESTVDESRASMLAIVATQVELSSHGREAIILPADTPLSCITRDTEITKYGKLSVISTGPSTLAIYWRDFLFDNLMVAMESIV